MNYCSICGRYTSVKGIIRPVVVFDRGRMKRRLRKMYFCPSCRKTYKGRTIYTIPWGADGEK